MCADGRKISDIFPEIIREPTPSRKTSTTKLYDRFKGDENYKFLRYMILAAGERSENDMTDFSRIVMEGVGFEGFWYTRTRWSFVMCGQKVNERPSLMLMAKLSTYPPHSSMECALVAQVSKVRLFLTLIVL